MKNFSSNSKKALYAIFAIAFASLIFSTAISSNAKDIENKISSEAKKAVVKIFTTKQNWLITSPWTKGAIHSFTGSGAFFEDGKIITNAHVVADATFIQFQFPDIDEKYEAELVAVNHEVDLAIIAPAEKHTAKIKPLNFEKELPRSRDKVVSAGFPVGGEQINFTEGVISRIDVRSYSHSRIPNLIVQTDAAINPGNSGGPVFSTETGKCVGIISQKIPSQDRIAYFIPVPVINQFLDDYKDDGKISGIPGLGIAYQKLENKSMRKYYKAGENSGVLIIDMAQNSALAGIVVKEDILVSFNGYKISTEGNVTLAEDIKVPLAGVICTQKIGQKVPVEFLHDGVLKSAEVTLKRLDGNNIINICPEYDRQLPYQIIGGVVFSPLTQMCATTLGDSFMPGDIKYYAPQFKGKDGFNELVIVVNILADSINRGYMPNINDIVESVNGKKVADFNEFKKAVETAAGDYYIIKFLNGQIMTIDKSEAAKKEKTLMERYNVKM